MTEMDLKYQDLKREYEELKEENKRIKFSNSLLEKELQEYRELDEQGLIPKYQIGDTAYFLRQFKGQYHVKEGIISELYYNYEMKLSAVVKGQGRGVIGDRVFLTEQEVQVALEKMKGENNG